MTLSLKHSFASTKAETSDPTLVGKNEWNAEHTILMASSRILGRISSSDGAVEELTFSNILSSSSAPGVTVDNTIPRFNGTSWALQTSGITIDDSDNVITIGTLTAAQYLGAGAPLSNIRLAKTALYTVLNADKGKTLALGGSAFYTLTFGAASGYDANFWVTVENEDSTRAKDIAISGGTTFRLYAGQHAVVLNQNNVWFVQRQSRKTVTSTMTFYVDTALGSDTLADGLGTGAGAFATVQKAVNIVGSDLLISAAQVNIQLTSGQTYAEQISLVEYLATGLTATQNNPTILGLVASPGNYTIDGTNGIAILGVTVTTPWQIKGITLKAATGSAVVEADIRSIIYLTNVVFPVTTGVHVKSLYGGKVEFLADYTISGGASNHFQASASAGILIQPGKTVTLTGTPAFSQFAVTSLGAYIDVTGTTYSGAATGTRWVVYDASVINFGGTTSALLNGLPGNANGSFDAFPAERGGTGNPSYVVGDILYASAGTTLSRLADVAGGSVLISGGAATAPAYSKTPTLGASGTLGSLTFGNATSGLLTLQAVTGALGTVTVSLPAATDTLVGKATTDTLTNKTLTSPTMTTPVLGAASATSLAFTSTSGIIGTTTNDTAAALSVGEFVSATLTTGSAISCSTGTSQNITSISLTAGDWDVSATAMYNPAATTLVSLAIANLSIVNGTTLDQTAGKHGAVLNPGGTNGQQFSCWVPMYRMSLSGTTTVYLNVYTSFSVSTLGAWGILSARRVR